MVVNHPSTRNIDPASHIDDETDLPPWMVNNLNKRVNSPSPSSFADGVSNYNDRFSHRADSPFAPIIPDNFEQAKNNAKISSWLQSIEQESNLYNSTPTLSMRRGKFAKFAHIENNKSKSFDCTTEELAHSNHHKIRKTSSH